ncbi:uncharacterized protein BDZ99DRAFT_150837 [Mytilinidion resinicola]|uniref:BTB domain-containing protein n=1 Tax=Mytilinidion resinicola TaxID=574789 RepID=A0A6A6Y9P7_9PEZI|nr:uncharacterized protein BDZ99DRAFT_150837 [Mytilinidion resinicola]KAF2804714.1 hypothetical protein BDZ99DRAFT_150837 [Mytilinidion resinicola]
MSGYLWKYFLEDDVENFRHILESGSYNARPGAQKGPPGWQGGNLGDSLNSPSSLGASPTLQTKSRKATGTLAVPLTRADINSRDATGLTILHHAATITSDNAIAFAQALLEQPLTDLYIQDQENGWTALHRAFYFGNIAIARIILNRDAQDILGYGLARGLVKIKDKEGNGPLDLFSMTIKDRVVRPDDPRVAGDSDSDSDGGAGESADRNEDGSHRKSARPLINLEGDEVFTFGSNKNVTLGFGDEDDRQFPERVTIRRPDHLVQRFYAESREKQMQKWSAMNVPVNEAAASRGPPTRDTISEPTWVAQKSVTELPTVIRNTPLVIQDVQMSKLHTAVLTTDPVSNLYVCGHGPGARLGLGHETTRYQFTCIEGGGLGQKKVMAVALGQNHTLAITDDGEIFSWGNNAYGQLGYNLPKTTTLIDEDPKGTSPRQIFGPLKRELVIGVAASRVHSVAHTANSLFTFGKNEGQLGITGSDARSLEVQSTPRKIAASLFSSNISSVSAIDGATVCLLENHDVWVFANFGYSKLSFDLEGFTNYFLKRSFLTTNYYATPNRICKLTCGGDTICALSTSGDLFTVAVSKRSETSQDTSTSTTNPTKIRGALSQPYRIWSAKKGHMVARDVAVDQDGSIILTTEAGSVWRRTKRATIKDATASGIGDYRPKDYKFSRVPGLTRVTAVRASAFGAYAAVRRDCDVTRTQIVVDELSLWTDVEPLLAFRALTNYEENSDDENPSPRFWQRPSKVVSLRKRVLASKDLESEVADVIRQNISADDREYDLDIGTSSSEVRIPAHRFMFSGRSRVIRQALATRQDCDVDMLDIATVTHDQITGKTTVLFQGVDFLTIFNLVLFVYTDSVVDFWHAARSLPKMAVRFRNSRTEIMKLASRLEIRQLERSTRQMITPVKSMNLDMELAIKNASIFEDGDVLVQLSDGDLKLHSAIICQRCPFFHGMFKGRAGGQWLAGRRDLLAGPSDAINVDLKHVDTRVFWLVVRHIYADAGEELFDDVVSDDFNDILALDELLDHVMDVMGVANELMLDRLSQACQKVVGRYVNARNVCQLLNAIAPSSVTELKNAGLEYICLSLEAVMQNGSLDELDEDLLLELNQVARDNQLAYLPFAKSGRAEALLLEKYPGLVEQVDRARRAKVDSIILSNKYNQGDRQMSGSFRAQSLEELSTSPLRQKNRRKSSKDIKSASFTGSPQLQQAEVANINSTDRGEGQLHRAKGTHFRRGRLSPALTPILKGKNSLTDLMFEMSSDEEDAPPEKSKGKEPGDTDPTFCRLDDEFTPVGSPEELWASARRKSRLSPDLGVESSGNLGSPQTPAMKSSDRPWGSTPLSTPRLDMRDIMAQTSPARPSGLAIGLANDDIKDGKPIGSFTSKMSQRERKRLQQAQQLGQPLTPPVNDKTQQPPPTISPWRPVHYDNNSDLSGSPALATNPNTSRTNSTPQMTMRQTIANSGQAKGKSPIPPSQSRSVSNPNNVIPPPSSSSSTSNPIIRPHSIRHNPLPATALSAASPSQFLALQDVLSQQQAEKDAIREAAAKRSLQEIQQEQEFQEWWEQESKRVMQEEEARRLTEEREKNVRGRGGGKRGGKRGGRGRGKKDKEVPEARPAQPGEGAIAPPTAPPSAPAKHNGGQETAKPKSRGPRGSGRGGGRGGKAQGPGRENIAPPGAGAAS